MKTNELTTRLIIELIKHLGRDGDLDAPYMAIGNLSYTRNDLITHLINETDLGVKLMGNLLSLTLDLIHRKKEEIT